MPRPPKTYDTSSIFKNSGIVDFLRKKGKCLIYLVNVFVIEKKQRNRRIRCKDAYYKDFDTNYVLNPDYLNGTSDQVI